MALNRILLLSYLGVRRPCSDFMGMLQRLTPVHFSYFISTKGPNQIT